MSLQDRLIDDLKQAMRAGDELRRSVIRLIRSAVKNEEISKRGELDDDGVVEVLTRMSRQHRESIEVYRRHNRDDLAVKEEAELAVVLEYLPEQLSADEVRRVADQVAREVGAAGPADKGKLMGKLMPQLRGRADGGMVNTVVTELLESLTS